MPDRTHIQYYTQQGAITEPCEHGRLFDELPKDVPSLVKVVQGLLVPFGWAKSYDLNLSAARRQELYLRSVPEMLGRIVELDPSPLPVPRAPEKRLIGLCRDFAVILVSILRHQRVPARLRIGFAGYFKSQIPRYWDHRIAENWNQESGRWALVDPMIDDVLRKSGRIHIDSLDISRNSPFLVAGEVWLKCRGGQADAIEFGDSPDDLGMPPIRYALLQDFDALNKVETVGFDTWHELIDKPEPELTEDELALLDKVAIVTTNVDSRFTDLQRLYQASGYGKAVQSQLAQVVGVVRRGG